VEVARLCGVETRENGFAAFWDSGNGYAFFFKKQNPRFRAEKTACFIQRRSTPFFLPEIANRHGGRRFRRGLPLSHVPERSEHGILKALGLKRGRVGS
jgi:hypothetical protein